MWETYQNSDKAARLPAPPTRGENEVASREEALLQYPVGTAVGHEFADGQGKVKVFRGKVEQFTDTWTVEYAKRTSGGANTEGDYPADCSLDPTASLYLEAKDVPHCSSS